MGGVMAQSLAFQVDALVRSAHAFDAGTLSGEDCARLVTKFAQAEKALTAARIRAAARAAESNQHRKEGFADPSEWLSRHTGGTARDARTQLDTMQRLELCPATRDAVASGEVSLGQADEIARTEAEVTRSEATLLPLAKKAGLSKLRDEACKTRANAIPAEELQDRQHAARSVRHGRDDLGMIAGTFRLTPQVGVPFVNRLERHAQRLRRAAKQGGRTVERFEAYAADAFADLIQRSPTSATKSKRRDVDAVLVCDLRAY